MSYLLDTATQVIEFLAATAAGGKLERQKMASQGIKPADLTKEREESYASAQPLIAEAPPVGKTKIAAKPAKKAAAKASVKAANNAA